MIVSGALRDEIELGLAVLGRDAVVLAIVSAEDAPHSKPDPEGYLLGIAAARGRVGQRSAEQALVIEDSLAGVEAAKVGEAHVHRGRTQLSTFGPDSRRSRSRRRRVSIRSRTRRFVALPPPTGP